MSYDPLGQLFKALGQLASRLPLADLLFPQPAEAPTIPTIQPPDPDYISDPPPFTGGQCVGVVYRGTAMFNYIPKSGGTPSNEERYFYFDSPLKGVQSESNDAAGTSRVYWTDSGGQHTIDSLPSNSGSKIIGGSVKDIIRLDGQPDNCGNPPPPPITDAQPRWLPPSKPVAPPQNPPPFFIPVPVPFPIPVPTPLPPTPPALPPSGRGNKGDDNGSERKKNDKERAICDDACIQWLIDQALKTHSLLKEVSEDVAANHDELVAIRIMVEKLFKASETERGYRFETLGQIIKEGQVDIPFDAAKEKPKLLKLAIMRPRLDVKRYVLGKQTVYDYLGFVIPIVFGGWLPPVPISGVSTSYPVPDGCNAVYVVLTNPTARAILSVVYEVFAE